MADLWASPAFLPASSAVFFAVLAVPCALIAASWACCTASVGFRQK